MTSLDARFASLPYADRAMAKEGPRARQERP